MCPKLDYITCFLYKAWCTIKICTLFVFCFFFILVKKKRVGKDCPNVHFNMLLPTPWQYNKALAIHTFSAGWTSKCPYTSSVFFLGSVPSVPSNIGGSGIFDPSGKVWSPSSSNWQVAPNFSSSWTIQKHRKVKCQSDKHIAYLKKILPDVYTWSGGA